MRRPAWALVGAAVVFAFWCAFRPHRLQATDPYGKAVEQSHAPRAARQRDLSEYEGPATSPSIRGIVKHADGTAAPRATVCVFVDTAPGAAQPICQQTMRDGGFDFAPVVSGWYTVTAAQNGYLSNIQTVLAGTTAMSLTMVLQAGGVSAEGTVVDISGGVIAGAQVKAYVYNEDEPALAGATTTESDGRFQLNVPAGEVSLVAIADGYSSTTASIVAPTTSVRLRLGPSGAIIGTVVGSETRAPLAGLRISAYAELGDDRWSSVLSDSDGHFELRSLTPGGYRVTAQGELWRSAVYTVMVSPGFVASDLVVEARSAGSLSASVNVAGVPCSRGRVGLVGPVAQAVTLEGDGTAHVLGLLLGEYEVTVACAEGAEIEDRIAITAGTPRATRKWSLQPVMAVGGTVHDANGEPVSGVVVTAMPSGPPEGRTAIECTTGQLGRFRCAGVSPGTYECSVQNNGVLLSNRMTVASTSGATTPADLRLVANATLAVRVIDRGGAPVDQLTVSATNDGTSLFATGIGSGEYRVAHLPLGTYRVSLVGESESSATVELRRSGETARVELTAMSNEAIRGRVIDDNGWPVPDAWVRMRSETSPFVPDNAVQRALTDHRGEFVAHDVRPGKYTVIANSAFGEGRINNVSAGTAVTVQIQSFGSINGSAIGDRGEPIEDLLITYQGPDGMRKTVAGIDHAGRWSLPWLSPGTWRVEVEAKGRRALSDVAVTAGQAASIAFKLQ